jgi:deazaflavin-dependent oxidoreductase (nitroreductase family)
MTKRGLSLTEVCALTSGKALTPGNQYSHVMGLISELRYEVKDANAIQRVTQKLTSSGPGAWVFQRTLYPVDKGLFRLTKGRLTVPGLMAGLPVIVLTTTGAKTGEDRTMPLVGIPIDGDMAVIGSNYGQSSTPGWVYNLRAHAEATVAHGSESVKVTARQATEAETERAFEAGAAIYGGFPKYREHASHREIAVFILEPRQT